MLEKINQFQLSKNTIVYSGENYDMCLFFFNENQEIYWSVSIKIYENSEKEKKIGQSKYPNGCGYYISNSFDDPKKTALDLLKNHLEAKCLKN